ncbi:hypothetical protein AWC35_08575 [Gibbsiella quercinecans]|uniref:Uncharacterized protein n=1 Tax=Gibbsiella quercinecans TaxID=929813 RepID=A0A250AZW8_9GAMM|nr:hypothetical protein AWC35_08575 [Gibbsiella quercinecans]
MLITQQIKINTMIKEKNFLNGMRQIKIRPNWRLINLFRLSASKVSFPAGVHAYGKILAASAGRGREHGESSTTQVL